VRRRQAAFTLIEMLVVLSLLAVLMGLGVGFIQRAGSGNRLILTTNALASQLATAREQAYGDRRAYVVVDTREDGATTIRNFRYRQVFAWACEDLERASEPDFLKPAGVTVSPDYGREGRYAVFSASGQVTLGDPPWLDFLDGFTLQFRLKPDGRAGTLFKKGTGNGLIVNVIGGSAGRMGLEAKITLQPDAKGEGGGTYDLRTGVREAEDVVEWGSPLIPGRWADVTISYDRNVFTIYVDGQQRAVRSDRKGLMVLNDDAFTIGGGYSGGFDSLVISGIFEDDEDRFDVPPEVTRLDAKGEKPLGKATTVIHFANRSLDPQYHKEPIRLWWRLDQRTTPDGETTGPRRVVDVALSGESFTGLPGER